MTRSRLFSSVRSARRGFTLLEVVLASVLLMLVTASIVTAVSSINRAEEGRRRRLAAYEVANRLMLMFVDDENSIKGPDLNPDREYEDFGYTFRWSIERQPVRVEGPSDSVTSAQLFNALELVRMRVHVGIRGNNNVVMRGEELAQVSRFYHTLHQSLTENHQDSRQRTAAQAAARALDLARQQGGGGGSGSGNGGNR